MPAASSEEVLSGSGPVNAVDPGHREKLMSLQIVVVSQTIHRANQIDRLLSGWRVQTVWASSIEECREHLSTNGRRLLIFDQVNSRISWRDALDTAHTADAPMIAVLEQFDSKRWVDILKGGASDVLADPLSQEQLRRSIDTASPGDALVQRPLVWDRLTHVWRAGRRLLHL
jgi:DNA-binding NtrC family response regulator